MASQYVIDCIELDNALRQLHDAVDTIKSFHPARLTGDAEFILDDVCDLIELLGKIERVRIDDRAKVIAGMFVLECLRARSEPVMVAAE
jgi:hypothetical protein